ncbi:MAG: glycosyltransferase family 2 protein [Anaerolineae bacterium]|nr:glycosyltransferase family 2 protein [Anaerolineae bacterium]
MIDVGVSVVNWNVRDLLAACLRSVTAAAAYAGLQVETWVVDNASHDGSADMVAQAFPDVRLIASDQNLGFGGGQNLAMAAMGFDQVPVPAGSRPPRADVTARPRYVLVLNPDTLVHERALADIVRFMDHEARAGVCGPRLRYEDGRFQHAAYRFPSLAQTFLDFWPINWRLTESRLNGRYARRLYDEGRPFPIDHPLGAAMLFRRETIVETGGFDLDYHMYVEEIDWCRRVKDAEWGIWCVPSAEVVHYEGQSTRQVRPQMVVALWRSRYIYFRKHHSRLFRWLARCTIRAGMRAKIRRTLRAASEGALPPADAEALVGAYRDVIAM